MRTFSTAIVLAGTLTLLLLAESAIPKEPVPDADSQATAKETINEVYEGELRDAKKPAAISQLASTILQDAKDSKTDAASRYVLLKMADKLAVRSREAALAMQVVDEMDKQFEIDALQIKFLVLQNLATKSPDAAQSEAMLKHLISLTDALAKHERFDQAIQMLRTARAAARKSRDTESLKMLTRRNGELERNHKAFGKIRDSLAILEKQPTDPDANLMVGRFRCFNMGQWEAGLAMLALGDDPVLKQAAVAELKLPTAAEGQVALADTWWDLSKQEKDNLQAAMRSRALFWYEKSLPQLSGLAKAKVSRRLAEEKGKDQPEQVKPKKLKYALNFNGSGYVRSNLRYSSARPMTLEAVVMPTSYQGDSSNKAVVGTYYHSGMGLMLNGSNRWGFLVKDSQARWAYSLAPAQLGKMVHLAGVYDGKTISLFVDGKAQSTTAMRGPHQPSKQPIGIGSYPRPGNKALEYFRGQIAAVRISAAALYKKDFKPEVPFKATKDTVLLYQFEEGKGQRVKDLSSHENHGQIINAFWSKLKR